jgi:alkylresorcinol/alkylpyrone synthase
VQKPFRQWEAAVRARFSVEIASVACVVPEHKVSQQMIAEAATRFFPHLEGSSGLFANTGIESRYVCEPPEWYFVSRGWEERTASFQRHALDLLEQATQRAVEVAGIRIEDIAAIVTNTVTGLAVPSLEARLMDRLPFSRQAERLPIFGLGCGGGVGGIARAVRLAETMPGAYVLFLAVDLCSLCARGDDPSLANFVSIALFGDGAGAVLLRNAEGGTAPRRPRGRIVTIGEHCWPGTLQIMGWDVKENGFGVVLSPELPSLLRRELKPAIEAFLAREGSRSATSTASCCIPAAGASWTPPRMCSASPGTTSSTPGRCSASTATCRRRRPSSSWSAPLPAARAGAICSPPSAPASPPISWSSTSDADGVRPCGSDPMAHPTILRR